MFDFFNQMRQQALFGKQFECNGQQLLLIQALGLKRQKQDGDENEHEWVLAIRADDTIPAPTVLAHVDVSFLLGNSLKDK